MQTSMVVMLTLLKVHVNATIIVTVIVDLKALFKAMFGGDGL